MKLFFTTITVPMFPCLKGYINNIKNKINNRKKHFHLLSAHCYFKHLLRISQSVSHAIRKNYSFMKSLASVSTDSVKVFSCCRVQASFSGSQLLYPYFCPNYIYYVWKQTKWNLSIRHMTPWFLYSTRIVVFKTKCYAIVLFCFFILESFTRGKTVLSWPLKQTLVCFCFC